MAVRTGSWVTGSWGTFPVKPRGSCLMSTECPEGLMAMGRELLTRAHRDVTTKDQAAHDAGHSCRRGSGPGGLTPAWALKHSMTPSLS